MPSLVHLSFRAATKAWPLVAAACICLFAAQSASPSTHYIAANGSDSNDGATTSAPWSHLPGMATCTRNCASYAPVAGDRFVLKGGDIWTNGSFPCTWASNGSAGNPIYIGVDQTWFSGSTWNRPVFDANATKIVGPVNGFLDLNSRNYVTVDNIEMRGLYWDSAVGYSTLFYIRARVADNITLSNLYLHRWTHGGTSADDLAVVLGDSNPAYNNSSVFMNGIIQNADGNSDSGEDIMAWGGSVRNSVFHDSPNALLVTGNGEISGNLIYNIYRSFSGTHPNGIEVVGANGPHYIHDNVIHDITIGVAAFIGGFNFDTFIWNNVIYNLSTTVTAISIDGRNGTAASIYVWNNTIVPYSGASCILNGHAGTMLTIMVQNNQCISINGSAVDPSLSAVNKTIDHTLLQTPTASAAQGYSIVQSFVGSPTLGSATIGAGTNLSSHCGGVLAGLCNGTTYAGMRTPNARGSTWDIGAYQFLAITTPNAPSMLSATTE